MLFVNNVIRRLLAGRKMNDAGLAAETGLTQRPAVQFNVASLAA